MSVTVIGGGLAGMVAARELARVGLSVVLLEASGRLGGQLATHERWGDTGAEAFLVRRPEVAQLCLELGLAGEVVHPSVVARPHVLVRGGLRRLPTATVMGVPRRLSDLRGVISPLGQARAALDLVLPHREFDHDRTIGGVVRSRFGREVAEVLVDPLLGGVYSGRADGLSLGATVAALDVPGRSLLRVARQVPAGPPGPVFATLRDGLGSLVRALEADLRSRGVQIRLGSATEVLPAGATVLCLPAPAAAQLLATRAPRAAATTRATPYATVTVLTLVWPRGGAGRLEDPELSGWLVPVGEGRVVKAVTVLTSKWPHLRQRWPGHVVVRASVGRFGEDHAARDGTWLRGVAAAEVSEVAGSHRALLDSVITRWQPALPQYLIGHPARVASTREGLPAGVFIAGAAWDGVGLPAVVASARRAAAQAADWSHEH